MPPCRVPTLLMVEGRGVPASLVEATVEASRDGRGEAAWAEEARRPGSSSGCPPPAPGGCWCSGFPEDVLARLPDVE
jgi:hypothetical protein